MCPTGHRHYAVYLSQDHTMTPKINLIAPLNSLGYGVAGQNLAYALHAAGAEVSLFPIAVSLPNGDRSLDIHDARKPLVNELKANAACYDPTAPSVRIWHQFDLAEHVGRALHVGFPFFELDRFNARERNHISRLDRLFVTSHWARQVVLENNTHHDVRVVPLGVDRGIFREDLPATSLTPDHTVFLNAGKWEVRKGHDFLLQCFCRAFRPTDKVTLKMYCFNPFIGKHNDVWARRYLGSPMGPKIVLEPPLATQDDVARAMMGADCGVFPSRGEAWNFELLEMMSLGKPVIATFATGQTAYLKEDNARLVFADATEPAEDGVWFHGQGNWTALGPAQEEQMVEHMREVHRLKQTGQLPTNEAGVETARRFSWENAADIFLRELQ